MDKKAKIIITVLCCACVVIAGTSVSFVMGTRLSAPPQVQATATAGESGAFAAIEKVGYAPGGTPVYRQPDTGSEVIASVGEGEAILLIGQREGWYRCMVQQVMGYIPAGSVSDALADGREEQMIGGGHLEGGGYDADVGGRNAAPELPVPPTMPTRGGSTTTAAPPKDLTVATNQEVVNQTAIANNMLAGINEGRAENGLPGLAVDEALRSSAQSEAVTAAKNGAGPRLSSEGGARRIGKLSDYALMEGITRVGVAVVSGKGGYYYVIKVK